MSQLKKSHHLCIPFKDIEIATKNFEESVCIGRGGYGRVYKGELFISGKQTTVAVKRLNENLGQGLKEFLTEIQLLSGQMHPNLISLLGYCDEGKEKIIVYEYAERGSLNRYIQRHNTTHTLTWLERLKICVHAARGLEFLHNHVGKHQSIIHRDIKSANILIDQNWDAKISDLGLSKLSLAGLNRSIVVSHPCGTPGYCEPEYFETGIVKKESDVYSFGMVLFEVLCGRLCRVKDHDDFLLSARLIKDYYQKNNLMEIIDPVLRNQTSSECLEKFSAIAYGCLLNKREQRPPINLVVKELEELMKIQVVRFRSLEKPNEDEFCLRLSKLQNYENIVKRLARHLNLDNPSKIRLTSSCLHSLEPKLVPVKYHGVEHLSVMLTGYGQTSDILYYEVVDIPLRDDSLQWLGPLEIVFKDKAVIRIIKLPRESTVRDLLNILKKKVELSYKDAELRLHMVYQHTISRVWNVSKFLSIPHREKERWNVTNNMLIRTYI